MEAAELLRRSIEDMSLTISEGQLAQFMEYLELLLSWNEKMNLTAIREPQEIITKHFVDSVSLLAFREISRSEFCIDVGTGAGFPGIPLAILRPDARMVLLDSLLKRIRFLQEVSGRLGLSQVDCVHARAEEAARDTAYREQADLCFARAVAGLSALCAYCLPFVKVGGDFIAYKGPKAEEEISEARASLKALGGEIIKIEEVDLPYSDLSHRLIFIRKVRHTSPEYFRNSKKSRKGLIK